VGDAKRRGDLSTRIAQSQARGRGALPAFAGSEDRLILVCPCLMSAARRCAVSFRVVADQPAAFMCHYHWRLVPEAARENLRKAAADHKPGSKPSPMWQLAVKTAVLAVMAQLAEIEGGSIPSPEKNVHAPTTSEQLQS